MASFRDKTGLRIGILTVLKRYRYTPENYKKPQTFYDCICDCGTLVHVSDSGLESSKRNKNTPRSCGCLQVDWLRLRSTKPDGVSAKNSLYSQYRGNARQRGHSFNLSKEEFFSLVFKDCYYCSSPPTLSTFNKRGSNVIYTGVDRLNNLEGYIYENCVPCCKWCNIAKKSLTKQEFLENIERLVSYLPTTKLNRDKPGHEVVINYIFKIYKRNAKNRKIPFKLSKENIKEIIFSPCSYCGKEESMLNCYSKRGGPQYLGHNGIDRIISTQGYTIENSVPCCKFCNYAKNTQSRDEFITWASRVYHKMIDNKYN